MNLDSDSATHARMELQSRCSHKYVLLQVWCGLLTVAMVVMAAVLTSIKPKPAGEVSSLKSDYITPTDKRLGPSGLMTGSSPSCIQLIKSSGNHSWEIEHECESSSLYLQENSVHCSNTSLYFLYAQVTFSRHPRTEQTKYVVLLRNCSSGKTEKILIEGIFPHTTESSVWVAKIVKLEEGDRISLKITDDFLTDNTFWGVFQLH